MPFNAELFFDVSQTSVDGRTAVRRVLWTGADLADGTTRSLPCGEALIEGEESPIAVRKIYLSHSGRYHMELADGRELLELQDPYTHRQWLRFNLD